LEEIAEGVEAIGGKDSRLHKTLIEASNEVRNDSASVDDEIVNSAYFAIDRIAKIDSLADQYVTLIGTARALGMDIEGAVKEVEASNLSKFIYVGERELTHEDLGSFAQQCNDIELQGRYRGVHWKRIGEYIVFYDQNGKILKNRSTYFEPNLTKFI
jgi:hypothetical protein